jgi:hypothetical protein
MRNTFLLTSQLQRRRRVKVAFREHVGCSGASKKEEGRDDAGSQIEETSALCNHRRSSSCGLSASIPIEAHRFSCVADTSSKNSRYFHYTALYAATLQGGFRVQGELSSWLWLRQSPPFLTLVVPLHAARLARASRRPRRRLRAMKVYEYHLQRPTGKPDYTQRLAGPCPSSTSFFEDSFKPFSLYLQAARLCHLLPVSSSLLVSLQHAPLPFASASSLPYPALTYVPCLTIKLYRIAYHRQRPVTSPTSSQSPTERIPASALRRSIPITWFYGSCGLVRSAPAPHFPSFSQYFQFIYLR